MVCIVDVVVWLLSVSMMLSRFCFPVWGCVGLAMTSLVLSGFLSFVVSSFLFLGAVKLIDGTGELKISVGLCLEGLSVVGGCGDFESGSRTFLISLL